MAFWFWNEQKSKHFCFWGEGKAGVPGKHLSEQGKNQFTATKNSTHIWPRVRESNPTHTGAMRKRAFSTARTQPPPKGTSRQRAVTCFLSFMPGRQPRKLSTMNLNCESTLKLWLPHPVINALTKEMVVTCATLVLLEHMKEYTVAAALLAQQVSPAISLSIIWHYLFYGPRLRLSP